MMPASEQQVAYTTVPALAQDKVGRRVGNVSGGSTLMRKLRGLAARGALRLRVE